MNSPQPGITQLNADLAESLREGSFSSLVLLDVDHFHQINADLGKDKGDSILALVEETISQLTSTCYRIGGDTYAVLGINRSRADEVRGAVKMTAHQRLQTHVSLSGGGVSIRPELLAASEEAVRLLYSAASQMLALAKQGGRDEIFWLTDDASSEGETGAAALQLFRDLARVNASRARQMEVESKVDPLTGLFNRRGFEDIFARMVESSQRTERPLGLLYMDSDSLKSINDRERARGGRPLHRRSGEHSAQCGQALGLYFPLGCRRVCCSARKRQCGARSHAGRASARGRRRTYVGNGLHRHLLWRTRERRRRCAHRRCRHVRCQTARQGSRLRQSAGLITADDGAMLRTGPPQPLFDQ